MADVVRMPKLGFDMAEGVLIRWVGQEGEQISKGDILAEIETDKATVEVETPYSGIIYKHLASEGDILPVGEPIAIISAEGEKVDVSDLLGDTVSVDSREKKGDVSIVKEPVTPSLPSIQGNSTTQQKTIDEDGTRIKASPLAKKIARENDIDISVITGSGPGGRIVKSDVLAYLEKLKELGPKAIVGEDVLRAAVSREDTILGVSKLREIIGRRMVASKQSIPHFYVTSVVDVTDLLERRGEINSLLAEIAEENEKISINDFIIKAVSLALRKFPNLNASITGEQIVQHGNINIGVAVAVDQGLLTVVVKNADVKPIRQISKEVREMAARVREGKVKPDDIEGSTFSVSNLGMFGVDEFSAIINPPEVAILAVGGASRVPAIDDSGIAYPRWQMKLTISVDHRVSDGVEAALFLKEVKRQLENPIGLLVL